MTEKRVLLRELKEAFEKTKRRLGFKATFEELDRAFNLIDAVLSADFVSPNFGRQICSRIVDNYMGWYNYLNGLLMPSPNFLASQTEANLFNNDEDREMIWGMIKRSMEFFTKHSLLGLNDNPLEERLFIDEALKYWKEEFSPQLNEILVKARDAWME